MGMLKSLVKYSKHTIDLIIRTHVHLLSCVEYLGAMLLFLRFDLILIRCQEVFSYWQTCKWFHLCIDRNFHAIGTALFQLSDIDIHCLICRPQWLLLCWYRFILIIWEWHSKSHFKTSMAVVVLVEWWYDFILIIWEWHSKSHFKTSITVVVLVEWWYDFILIIWMRHSKSHFNTLTAAVVVLPFYNNYITVAFEVFDF